MQGTTQQFNAPVDRVAGRDVINAPQITVVGQVSIGVASEDSGPISPDQCRRAHRRLIAVRAELRRMLVFHRKWIPYLLSWLVFAAFGVAFLGSGQPLHGAIMFGWGLCVIAPTGWVMGRAGNAMFDELLQVQRELRQLERRLVRAEAELRAFGEGK